LCDLDTSKAIVNINCYNVTPKLANRKEKKANICGLEKKLSVSIKQVH
jgi:hypothetical protein